ncbi:midcut-by-XrtH protein [Diaphorobacter sp. HDW4A]|uniref:midcut-by-XrtH protein n=1 Tax=Diaphorobacter sp. HDW4A TaxID=2714924 RepID=UPI0014089FBD|nr:midcut-by-XrtH protein [Diaphorobacter sp. HDW4A]QIL80751.1 midcut-by-XrtH protein [Diaphorobacter sp. HDW4A]
MKLTLKCDIGKLTVLTRVTMATLATAGVSASWAQQVSNACQISLGYAPVPVPPATDVSSVPGLTMSGIGLLAVLFGFVGWKLSGKNGSRKLLSVFLIAGALTTFFLSSESIVRAAGPYEFSDVNGGVLTDTQIAFATPSPLITVTNSSGKRMRITTNGNSVETGTCIIGSELAPGASCTSEAVCPVVVPVQVASDPTLRCDTTSQIDSYTWAATDGTSNGSVIDYQPVLDTSPVTTPAVPSLSVSFSYTRSADQPEYDANGVMTNITALGSGTATIIATAPQGYGFGSALNPTQTWTLPYTCQDAVTNQGGGGSGGNN